MEETAPVPKFFFFRTLLSLKNSNKFIKNGKKNYRKLENIVHYRQHYCKLLEEENIVHCRQHYSLCTLQTLLYTITQTIGEREHSDLTDNTAHCYINYKNLDWDALEPLLVWVDKKNSMEFPLGSVHYLYNYYMVCVLLSYTYHVTLLCDMTP